MQTALPDVLKTTNKQIITDDTIIKIESRANHIIAKNKNKAVSRLIFLYRYLT